MLIKSRVALYEATFEKYHQGTGRVPGDETWPGKSVHPNFSLDVTAEINFFLDQCMDAASQVADAITLTENTGVSIRSATANIPVGILTLKCSLPKT